MEPTQKIITGQIQPSMTNTMGYLSAVGESRQQLVVTRKLPQFTSFLGDNWRKFIIKWSDYSISVGSNCRSISESTSILCKQQASMFFDTEIWTLDNNRLKEILNNHFRVVTTHDIYARLQPIAMDSQMWKPDVNALDQYCNRFPGILNELDSSSISKIEGLELRVNF